MRVTVKGGIANHGEPSLCLTCRYATIVRGRSLGAEVVECAQLSIAHKRIAFPVVTCSDYNDRRRASLREMEEIAWILRSDTRKGDIGFVKASALRPRERFVLEEDQGIIYLWSRHRVSSRCGAYLRSVAGRPSLCG